MSCKSGSKADRSGDSKGAEGPHKQAMHFDPFMNGGCCGISATSLQMTARLSCCRCRHRFCWGRCSRACAVASAAPACPVVVAGGRIIAGPRDAHCDAWHARCGCIAAASYPPNQLHAKQSHKVLCTCATVYTCRPGCPSSSTQPGTRGSSLRAGRTGKEQAVNTSSPKVQTWQPSIAMNAELGCLIKPSLQ